MRISLIQVLVGSLLLTIGAQGAQQQLRRVAREFQDDNVLRLRQVPVEEADKDNVRRLGDFASGPKRAKNIEPTHEAGRGRLRRRDAGAARINAQEPDSGRPSSSTVTSNVPARTNPKRAVRKAARAVADSSSDTDSKTAQKTESTASTVRTTGETKTRSRTSKSTRTTSSTSAAPTSSQTPRIEYDKVNMTLASMPYEQVMCKNTTEVQSGSVLNATWLSRGKYTNTVYIRYGTDGYAAWNLPAGGALPPFAGVKVRGDPEVQDPDASYRMTFQTPVFAYQKGIKLSILLFDNQRNRSVVTFESPEIFIRNRCEHVEQAIKQEDKEKEPTPRQEEGPKPEAISAEVVTASEEGQGEDEEAFEAAAEETDEDSPNGNKKKEDEQNKARRDRVSNTARRSLVKLRRVMPAEIA